MKKEPLILYLFRIFLFVGIFFFVVLLYWSSLLVEEDLKSLKVELINLKKEIDDLQVSAVRTENVEKKKEFVATKERPHIDPQYPNLLQEDPFYEVTLPKMLGPHFPYWGVRQEATIGKPDNLHPFSNWSQIS